jgi:hypothetical protein
VDCMRHIIGCVVPCETQVQNIHGSFERAGNLLNFLGVTKSVKKLYGIPVLDVTYH